MWLSTAMQAKRPWIVCRRRSPTCYGSDRDMSKSRLSPAAERIFSGHGSRKAVFQQKLTAKYPAQVRLTFLVAESVILSSPRRCAASHRQ